MPQLSPDGLYEWDGVSWKPYTAPPPPPPPQAAPPPPTMPPPPTQGYAVPPMPPTPPQYTAPVIPQAPVPQAFQGSDIDFAATAWTSGHALGDGFVVLIEDIEEGTSQNDNPTLKFQGKTLQPNGATPAGYKSQWSYTITDKAIGKLGKDMLKLGITRAPRSGLGQALLGQLRGKVIVLNSRESKNSDFPNIEIVGPYQQTASTPQAAPVAPPAPQMPPQPPPPPAAPQGYAVGFPAAPPPPPPGSAFSTV